jgi:CheY-like chemotaxis protein
MVTLSARQTAVNAGGMAMAPGAGDPYPWIILIADDDDDVHAVTELVLGDTRFDGRPLAFLHAYSAQETVETLRSVPDVSLVLLDVVMETDDAGLRACRAIREDLGNTTVRIVLRTGQPGAVPESEVIRRYDINDFKEKTELTTRKMETIIFAALRSYRDIVALARCRAGLAAMVEATVALGRAPGVERLAAALLDQAAVFAGDRPGGGALPADALDRLAALARLTPVPGVRTG